MRYDVAIVGAGPAGLALAIQSARRGLSAVVLDRSALPRDKACGEGVMPRGVRLLRELGVTDRLSASDAHPLQGIQYVQEDGSSAVARFRAGRTGLGIRRLALAEAMLAEAYAAGADVRPRCSVLEHAVHADRVALRTTGGDVDARLLVAADGLGSPLRHWAGLELPSRGPRRFGLRQHFHLAPWSSYVEVYFSAGAEAYVTPVGPRCVCVAFLWEDGQIEGPIRVGTMLDRFSGLRSRLAGAAPDSKPLGAGPLERRTSARTARRLALLGDAAGSVDALTGEGLSLALMCAAALSELLPAALADDETSRALANYERAAQRVYAPYIRLAQTLLFVSRRPALRRAVVQGLQRAPWIFERVLGHHSV